MARPKSKTPIKSKIISVRMTEEKYFKLITIYGSIQKFIDNFEEEKIFEINSRLVKLSSLTKARSEVVENLQIGETIELDDLNIKRVA